MRNLTKYLIVILAIISSGCLPLEGDYRYRGARYIQIFPFPNNDSGEATAKSKPSDPRAHPPNEEKFIAAHRLAKEKNYQEALSLYREIDVEGLDQVQNPGPNVDLSFNQTDPKKRAKKKEYYVYLKQQEYLSGARYNIGNMYEKGYLGNKDYKEAVKWYLKAADSTGYPYDFNAMIRLYLFYYYGLGVPQSKSESIAWLNRASDLFKRSDKTMGAIHKFAIEVDAMPASLDEYDNFDTRATYQKAVEFFSKGNKEGGAKLMLSCVIRGDSKDEIFHKAEAKTGYFFLHGEGLPRNHEYAIKLLTRAADSGDSEANFHLAMIYRNGEYVQKDKAKSDELLKKAADSGSVDAKKFLYADEQELKRDQAREQARKKKEEAENLKFVNSLSNAQQQVNSSKKTNASVSSQEKRSQCLAKCNMLESDCERGNNNAYSGGFLLSGDIDAQGALFGQMMSSNCSLEESSCRASCGQ